MCATVVAWSLSYNAMIALMEPTTRMKRFQSPPSDSKSHATEAELNLRIMVGLDVFILICVGLDTLWRRRLHPAFAWGAFLFVGAFHVALYVTTTPAWIAFGESLVS
jgi:hypothetical protein